MHAFYSDINFAKGTINVSDKPNLNFTIKDKEVRHQSMDLPKDFVLRIKERIKRHNVASDETPIFPNEEGRPFRDVLRLIRNVAQTKTNVKVENSWAGD